MPAISYDINVRYNESGADGIVYYANYFSWYELAQHEFLLKSGLNFAELQKREVMFVVIDMRTRFFSPVRFGDKLRVDMYVRRVSNIKVDIDFELVKVNDGTRAASASAVYTCVDKNQKPRPLSKVLPELYTALLGTVESKRS